jgi:hypothetical protein
MIRKILLLLLALTTLAMLVLTFQRINMDYDENGVYLEDGVTYDSDARLVYIAMTLFFLALLITTGMFLKAMRKKRTG